MSQSPIMPRWLDLRPDFREKIAEMWKDRLDSTDSHETIAGVYEQIREILISRERYYDRATMKGPPT